MLHQADFIVNRWNRPSRVDGTQIFRRFGGAILAGHEKLKRQALHKACPGDCSYWL